MSAPLRPPPLSHRYQALILGEGAAAEAKLGSLLRQRTAELGLGDDALHILGVQDFAQRDRKAPLAAVYVSGDGPREPDERIAAQLMRDGAPIRPLVPTVSRCKELLPECLRALNTRDYDGSEGARADVASWVLEELGLMPETRRVFLSYRRSESRAAAVQLYHALDEWSYQVFLDTHSIPAGRLFDPYIHHRIAGADILILLGTRDVFASKWVELEFNRADELGVGVLYVVWPGEKLPNVATLTVPHPLKEEDFVDFSAGPRAELTDAALTAIRGAAEGLRARTLAARQARIVGSFCRQLESGGARYRRTPERYLEVTRGSGAPRRIYPVVGVPETPLMQRVHGDCGTALDGSCLLYDSRAMLPEVIGHLEWLNGFTPVRALSLLQVDEWIAKL